MNYGNGKSVSKSFKYAKVGVIYRISEIVGWGVDINVGAVVGSADGITFGIDNGSKMGSSYVFFYGSNDGKPMGSLIYESLE